MVFILLVLLNTRLVSSAENQTEGEQTEINMKGDIFTLDTEAIKAIKEKIVKQKKVITGNDISELRARTVLMDDFTVAEINVITNVTTAIQMPFEITEDVDIAIGNKDNFKVQYSKNVIYVTPLLPFEVTNMIVNNGQRIYQFLLREFTDKKEADGIVYVSNYQFKLTVNDVIAVLDNDKYMNKNYGSIKIEDLPAKIGKKAVFNRYGLCGYRLNDVYKTEGYVLSMVQINREYTVILNYCEQSTIVRRVSDGKKIILN